MPKTILNENSYPNEDQDPHFTTLVDFYNQNDLIMWNNKLRSNFILAGGGTRAFGGTGLLQWTSNFAIKHLTTGFIIEYAFGPDGINREASILDGQILYGEFPSSTSENQQRNLFVADKLDKENKYFVLGWRYGSSFYFSDGVTL